MGIRLALLLLSFLCLMGFCISSFLHYSTKWKKKYNLRNMFPYEINYGGTFMDNGWGNIFLVLMTLSLSAYFIMFSGDFTASVFLPTKIIGAISVLVIPFVVLVPLKYLKAHIAIAVSQFFTSMALPASIAITALRTYQSYDMSALPIVILVLSLIMTIFILILVFNPNLSLRIMYEKSTNEKGEEVISRPKTIFLAFSEWLMIFSLFVDAILLFILMFSF